MQRSQALLAKHGQQLRIAEHDHRVEVLVHEHRIRCQRIRAPQLRGQLGQSGTSRQVLQGDVGTHHRSRAA